MGSDFMTITQLLDKLIPQPVDQGTLPHLYAAVARDGEVVYEGEAGDTARDRIYRIMSITKAVTSIACMQLVEQGQVSLDAPVTDYLEIAGPEVLEAVAYPADAAPVARRGRGFTTRTSGSIRRRVLRVS